MKTEWELIKVNPETHQTSVPDIFAGGDVSYGPKLFIDAIASGQVAARSIHDSGRSTPGAPSKARTTPKPKALGSSVKEPSPVFRLGQARLQDVR